MQTAFTLEPELQLSDRIYKTRIQGLFFISHAKNVDGRGFFSEIALLDDLQPYLPQPFIPRQINLARSETHVARGFHTENWNKLVTIITGTLFCADCARFPQSPTYADVVTFTLGPDSLPSGSIFISKGLGNSYCVVSGPCDYLYCVDQLYRNRDKQGDRAISLFDSTLNVNWPIGRESMILSARDQNALPLSG